MTTVRTFFGSDGAGGLALAVVGGGAAGAASGVATDAVLNAAVEVSAAAGAGAAANGGGVDPEPIGIVATTREPTLGGSMLTGCSSRETSLSAAAWVAAAAFAYSACASPLFGTILLGAMLALMIGGRLGNATEPNIAR